MHLLNAICRKDFETFAGRAFRIIEPGTRYEYNWHIGCIADHLNAVYTGEIRRLIINMPPRALKTTLVSILWPAWVLGIDPTKRFVNTSFKFERVTEMSLKCRQVMQDAWYKTLFPKTRLDPAQAEKHNFHTTKRGQYYSSPILAATGAGGDFVMCDDPINPVEAASEQMRKSVIESIRGTLFSRFNDPRTGAFIMVMQRLHERDPTGDLLADGGYHHLILPAEAKQYHCIKLGGKKWEMAPGELLFKARLSREILDEKRTQMTEYNYCAQYLQSPVPLGGGEFKPYWIQYYDKRSLNVAGMNVYILVDPSGGEDLQKRKKKTGDWSAFMVVGLSSDNNYYLLDIVRDRLNPTERVDMLFMLHRKWAGKCGNNPKVGYEKYGMMSDTHYIKTKQNQENYRFPLEVIGGGMMKEERIRRLIPDMENGRWWFPEELHYVDGEGRRLDLINEIIYSEMATFPNSRYDDMLDALSRIYEEDLKTAWPSRKKTAIESAVSQSYARGSESSQSWMDY